MSEPRTPLALWTVPVADLGGVARHVLDVTRTGIPGWRIVVLCPDGDLATRLQAQGSAVVIGSFGPGAGFAASRSTLAGTVRSLRPAIVHSHLAYADIISAATRLPRRTRRFTTEHGIAIDDGIYHRSGAQSRVMAFVHRLRMRRFAGIIAVSRSTRDTMRAKWHVRQHIEVIPNGVDLPAGTTRREGATESLRILSLSRLSPEKQIDQLIDAFALVVRERPDATLTIAGDGSLRAQLHAQVHRLGLDAHVSFPGYVDASEAMAHADVIAQLSVWENLSYTLLDAAARGIRIVASDVGGNSEIVEQRSLVKVVDAATVAAALLDGSVGGANPTPTTRSQMCEHLGRFYALGEEGSRC